MDCTWIKERIVKIDKGCDCVGTKDNIDFYRESQNPQNFTRITKSKAKRPEETVYVGNVDYVLAMSIILLVVFGITMIFSSSYYIAAQSNDGMFGYLKRQIVATAVGGTAMIVVAHMDYHFWEKYLSRLIYWGSIVLLVVVLKFGVEKYGARRWLYVPFLGSFQPSELAKVSLILYLAKLISEDPTRTKTIKGLLRLSITIFIPVGLVLLGKNLSTALILTAIGFGMIFIASPYFWQFVLLGFSGIGALIAYLGIFAKKTDSAYRAGRFSVWKDPFSDPTVLGYQTIQSLYSVASGGLFGLGLGQSRQKLKFLPEPHNDFIFAVICEELGLFGAGIIIFLFAILLWRGFRAAMKAPDVSGSLIASGAMIMIGLQVIINIGVVTNTIPNTGIPMPFISYGGTSVAVILFLMGIVLSVSRYSKQASR